MSIRLARWGLTALLVAALVAPEALLLHRCPCGRIFDCCCRSLAAHRGAHEGQSCHLGAAKGHCAASSSAGVPASVQSGRQTVERVGTWEPRPFTAQLLAVARIADPTGLVPEPPAFEPPVPPPRPS